MTDHVTASAGADEARPQLETRAARPARVAAPSVHTRAPSASDIATEIRRQGAEIQQIRATVTRSEGQRRLQALKMRAQTSMRSAVDQRDRMARRRRSDVIVDETIERTNAVIDAANERALAALRRENAELQRRLRRPQIDVRGGNGNGSTLNAVQRLHRAAVLHYMRTGQETFRGQTLRSIQSQAVRASYGGSGPDGGFLLMPHHETGPLEKLLAERVDMRNHCSVVSISAYTYKENVQTSSGSAKWGDELASSGETDTPKSSALDIPAMDLYAEPRVSADMLEDSAVDMEGLINEGVIDQFSLAEATAFTTGDGVKRPQGFLGLAAANYVADASWSWGKIGYYATSASGAFPTPSASVGSADPLFDLLYGIKAEYAQNGKWMANRPTIGKCRQLKDVEGRYAWSEGNLVTGQPATLVGHEIVWNAQMPNIGADKFALAFADWKRAYKIVDRVGITVLRDPFTAKPMVIFFTRKRVGGAVRNFEAIKLLKFGS